MGSECLEHLVPGISSEGRVIEDDDDIGRGEESSHLAGRIRVIEIGCTLLEYHLRLVEVRQVPGNIKIL